MGTFKSLTKKNNKTEISRKEFKSHFNLLDSITDSLLIFNRHLKLVEINKAALKAWGAMGKDKKDLIGKHVLELSSRPESKDVLYRYKKYREVLKTGKPFVAEELFSRPTFENRYALIRAFKVADGLGILATDITERKKITDELRQTKDHLAIMLKSTPAVIYTCETSGNYPATFISENIFEVLGYTQKEFLSRPSFWIKHLHPDDRRRILLGLKVIFKRGYHSYEYRFLHKNGTYRWMHDEMRLIYAAKGSPAQIVGHITDITERKKSEDELKKSKERLSSFMDSSTDSFMIFDKELNLIEMNKAGLRSWGLSRKETIGKNLRQLSPGVEKTSRYRSYLKVIKTGKPMVFEDFFGHPRFGKIHASLKAFRVGEGLGIIGEDISERKKTENMLLDSESKLRIIFESIAEAIFIFDKNGIIREVNKATCKMHGYKYNELIGISAKNLVAPESYPQFADYLLTLRRGQPFFAEAKDIRKDGTVFNIEAHGMPITWNGKLHFLGVVRDITKRKRAEEALRLSEERFQQVAQTAGECIWEVDAEGLYTYISPIVERALGYRPDELIGKKHFYDFFVPEEKAKLKKAAFRVFARKESFTGFVNTNLHRDGKRVVILETTGVPVLDKHGKLIGYRGADTDITERKKTEEALRNSEQKFKEIAASVPGVVYQVIVRKDGTRFYTFISEGSYKLFGNRPDEFYKDPGLAFRYIIPQDKKRVFALIDKSLKTLKPWRAEFQIESRWGGIRWVSSIASPHKLADGSILFNGLVNDITERKEAEGHLLISEEKFAVSFYENPNPLAITELKSGKIIEKNQAFSRWSGYSTKELMGNSTLKLHIWVNRADRKKMVDLVKAKGEANTIEAKIRLKSGSIRDVLFSARIIKFGKGNYLLSIIQDITERKQAEKYLKNYSEEISDLYNNSPCGYHSLDRNGVFVRINNTELKWLGYTWQEVVGKKKLSDILTKDSLKVFKRYFSIFKKRGWVRDLEFEFLRKDGTIMPVLLNATAIKDARGKYIMSRSTIFDITERKHMEAALKENELLLRQMVESIRESFWIGEAVGGKPLYISPAYERIWKLSAKSLYKDPSSWLKIIFKEDREKVNAYFNKINSGDLSQPDFPEFRIVWPDGSLHWISAHVYPVRDEKGKIYRLTGVADDVTEHKQAEEALKASEKKFRTIFDSASDGLISVDIKTNRFFNANKKMLRLLRYNSEEEIRKLAVHDIHLKRDAPRIFDEYLKHARGEISFSDDIPVKRKDGSVFPASISSSQVEIGGRKCLLCIFRDISERKQIEQAKDTLIRNVSHGLKSPIAITKMACDVIEQGIENNNIELIKRGYSIGSSNINKLQKDVKNILEIFSLKERERNKKRNVSLKKVIRKSILDLAYFLSSKRIKINIDIPKEAENITIIPRDLELLMGNILDNAVKFTDHGCIRIKSRRKANVIQIIVKDTGRGVDPAEKDRLFERFYKKHPALPGTGLGLSICKEIVQLYNGNIDIVSEGEGKGATIIVELPKSLKRARR